LLEVVSIAIVICNVPSKQRSIDALRFSQKYQQRIHDMHMVPFSNLDLWQIRKVGDDLP